MPLQSIPREKIIGAIAQAGPCQPIDIRRALGEGDTMLIGAMLSELVAGGKLLISKTKRGGSPFYYLPDHPETLERISQYLGEKDRRTYDLLRERKVLDPAVQDPLTRVSLQNIPDFSRQFTYDGKQYWRYYLVSEEEACSMITPATPVAEPIAAAPKAPAAAPKEKKARAPRKPRVKKADTRPAPLAQQTLDEHPLLARVRATIKEPLEEPQTTLTGLAARITVAGPYGPIKMRIVATDKRVTERILLSAITEARSHGMPLLLLCTDLPKKNAELIEDLPNASWKRLA